MANNFKITPHMPLQMGWIPYWNLRPLRQELGRFLGSEVELMSGPPSQVNRWLSEGRVALAPCSSVCLLKNPQHEMAFPIGVAAAGAVQSVYIGFQQEDLGAVELIRQRQAMLREFVKTGLSRFEGDVRKVAAFVLKMSQTLPPVDLAQVPYLTVTSQSATSAALARLFYRLWFGEHAYEARAADHGNGSHAGSLSLKRPAEMLIGDEALIKRPHYRAVIDLGEAWRELTDLPFVFAVFQTTKRTMSPYWRQRLFEAAEIAQARMRVEPCHYFPDMAPVDAAGRPIDLAGYWKLIQYRFTAHHFQGLALYLALVRAMSGAAMDDQAVVNIMRWQNLGSMGSSASL